MKRRLSFSLWLCALLSLAAVLFASCGKATPPPPTPLPIVENGECAFVIVYESGSTEARKQATALRSLLREAYGVALTPVSDEEAPAEHELLIGQTNRPLSSRLKNSLAKGEDGDHLYGIATDGSSLALYANTQVGWDKCFLLLRESYMEEDALVALANVTKVRHLTKAAYERELEQLRAEEEEKLRLEREARIEELKTAVAAFRPFMFGGTTVTTMSTELYAAPPVTPTVGEHPRLLFTKDDIPDIVENLTREECAPAYESFMKQVNQTENGKLGKRQLSENGRYNANFDASRLSTIQAKALYYALFGDEERGYEALLAIKNYLVTLDIGFYDSDVCRYYGYTMYITALVYDWCYDLMTDADKSQLLCGIEHLLCRGVTSENGEAKTEVGFPPTGGTGAVEGHGAEMAILRDYLSVAIAVYDEQPDWYALIGGRVFEEYIPIRNYFYLSGIYPEGTACYGPWRFLGDLWSAWMLTSSTGDNPYTDDMATVTHSFFGHETANGYMFATGDGNSNAFYTSMGYCALISSYLYDDSAARAEAAFVKSGFSTFGSGVANITPSEFLICSMKGTEAAEDRHSAIPLVLYNGGMYQQIIARTSWDSDAPVILMQGAGRPTVGHSHEAVGDFRIYYKGLLTGGDGVYDDYASSHHLYYNKSSIAHNCLLIYDPSRANEKKGYYSGGQILRVKTDRIEEFMSDPYYDTGIVRGVAFGQDDAGRPTYVYYDNDMTAAYDDTSVEHVSRRMLATFPTDGVIPMLLFTVDRIDAKNANFRKTFLLQAAVEPAVDTVAKTVTIDNGEGKLVLMNLLGADTIEAYGGDSGDAPQRFFITSQNKNLPSLGGTAGGGDAYQSGRTNGPMWGKVELCPATGSLTDYFVNVLYVADSNVTPAIEPMLVEGDTYIGAYALGQAAIFVKDATADATSAHVLSAFGEGEIDYYIGGLAAGTWLVRIGDGEAVSYTVTETEHLLCLRAPAGEITLIPGEDIRPSDAGEIVYQTDGGTLPANTPTSFTYGEAFALTAVPTRGADIFRGWFADRACTVPITEISADELRSRVTVYAGWTTFLLTEEYSGDTRNTLSYNSVSYANCTYTPVRDKDDPRSSYLLWQSDREDPQIQLLGSYAARLEGETSVSFLLTLGANGDEPLMATNLYFRDKDKNVVRVFRTTATGEVFLRTATNENSAVSLGTLTKDGLLTVRIVVDFQTGERIAYGADGTVLDRTEIALLGGAATHEEWLSAFTYEMLAIHADSAGSLRIGEIRIAAGNVFE